MSSGNGMSGMTESGSRRAFESEAWRLKVEESSAGAYRAIATHPDGRTLERTGPDADKLRRQIQEDMAQMDAAHGNLEPLLSPIMNAPIIEVRNLTKTFRVGEVDVHALQGIDLQVQRGEFLAIVGTSGSGKSTLFNILGGLTSPTTGSVSINSLDLSHMTDTQRNDLRKRTVGFVFQKYNLLPTLTAEQNIQIVRDVAKRPLAFDDQFKEVLAMLGIGHRMTHKRARSQAASSSASPSPGPLSTGLPFCWRTSRPEIWTPKILTSC